MSASQKSLVSRRSFLTGASSVGAAGAFSALLSRSATAAALRGVARGRGYGSLALVDDLTTGLPLIKLPAGFSYKTFGWTDSPMAGGDPTPGSHDGMAVVRGDLARVLLVRNHERSGVGSAFGANATYDASAPGGTTSLGFNVRKGEWLFSYPSLSGTLTNCAGGATPWGSWLTCEETTAGVANGYAADHGWIFEVPSLARPSAVPLVAMGRFAHEAIAVDPETGYVYETEDARYTSGFYRFRPNAPNQLFGLEAGGTLEMLKVVGVTNADLQQVQTGDTFAVEWVAIADPELGPQTGVGPFGGFDGETTSASGPFVQGHAAGGARFRRLEGCWYDGDGLIYFTDTEGGRPAADSGEPEGTVWAYDPQAETLRVVFESPAEATLDNPDNLAISPRGGIVLCEDGDLDGQRMHGLTPDGTIFEFAQNAIVLNGEMGFTGDFSDREWAGATFDPTGRWLFVNIQTPGITFAITGPWENGGL